MPPYHADEKLQSRDCESVTSSDALCLFLCTSSGFPKENIISVIESTDNPVFSGCHKSITSIFPYSTQIFFCDALKNRDTHYVLLLSNDRRPILVVTAVAEYGGLCLALALPASIDTVLSYLHTIPKITILQDPALSCFSPAVSFDPHSFERLRQSFRRIFTFFEAAYSEPMRCADPIALFRLMKQKSESLADLFGLRPQYLIPYAFDEPIRTDTTVNTNLFSATVLLLFSAVRHHSSEDTLHVVFISLDGCPAACIHFRSFSELDTTDVPYQLLTKISSRYGSYFKLCHGEEARKEAEKIPGVGFMVRNVRYTPLNEHVICAFSPVAHDFTGYISRSPIFHLPDRFYEGF